MEVARLPEREIEVTAGAVAPVPPVPTATPATAKEAEITASVSAHVGGAKSGMAESPLWFWLSLSFAGGWLITAGLWWQTARRSRKQIAKDPPESRKPSVKQPMRELKEACAANDPDRARKALLEWAEQSWPDCGTSLEGIAGCAEGELKNAVQALSRALYGHPRTEWKGAALWDAIVTTDLGKGRAENRGVAPIASLHPPAQAKS